MYKCIQFKYVYSIILSVKVSHACRMSFKSVLYIHSKNTYKYSQNKHYITIFLLTEMVIDRITV